MIISNVSKNICSLILSGTGYPMISGTMNVLIQLESSDSSNGQYWDMLNNKWSASPAIWPTGSHQSGGVWCFVLPATASNGRAGNCVHYVFITGSCLGNETISPVISSHGEHHVYAEEPLVLSSISASVWNASRNSHTTIGSMGQTMQFSSSYVDVAISSRSTGSLNVYESEPA